MERAKVLGTNFGLKLDAIPSSLCDPVFVFLTPFSEEQFPDLCMCHMLNCV